MHSLHKCLLFKSVVLISEETTASQPTRALDLKYKPSEIFANNYPFKSGKSIVFLNYWDIK